MPIIIAPLNEELTISKININDLKVKKHLESLGFLVGSKLEILEVSGGNLIIHIGNSRIALDKGTARGIHVY